MAIDYSKLRHLLDDYLSKQFKLSEIIPKLYPDVPDWKEIYKSLIPIEPMSTPPAFYFCEDDGRPEPLEMTKATPELDMFIEPKKSVMARYAEVEFRKDYWGTVGANPCGEIIIDDPYAAAFDPQLEAMCKEHDDHFWPHKGGCPVCGSDAYVGLDLVECSRETCQNWCHREGM